MSELCPRCQVVHGIDQSGKYVCTECGNEWVSSNQLDQLFLSLLPPNYHALWHKFNKEYEK